MAKLATIYRVKIEEGKSGLFFATSPDLRGLLVGRPTIDELYDGIHEAIAALIHAETGRKVAVFTAQRGDDPMVHPFVAVPLETLGALIAAATA